MVLRKNLMLRRLAPFATWPAADPQHRARPRRMGGMSAYLYILRCVDGSYYTGTTRGSLETRLAEHETGAFDGFTRAPKTGKPCLPSGVSTDRRCCRRQAAGQRLETRKERGTDPRRFRSPARAIAASFETRPKGRS